MTNEFSTPGLHVTHKSLFWFGVLGSILASWALMIGLGPKAGLIAAGVSLARPLLRPIHCPITPRWAWNAIRVRIISSLVVIGLSTYWLLQPPTR